MKRDQVGLVAAALALLVVTTPSRAQLLDSLTVTLSPGAVNFTLSRGSATNSGSAALAARTSWSLLTLTNVSLYAYFSSATSALVHAAAANTVDIPSSRVEVSINGGARVPFTQTAPFGAPSAARQIFSQPINVFNLTGNRTDTLALNINLAGYTLPADTYTGTLRIRARATP